MNAIRFVLPMLVVIAGCYSACPHHGGSITCQEAGDIISTDDANNPGGLCYGGSIIISGASFAQACEDGSPAFQDCFTACVESAGTCSEATDCSQECETCE